MLTKSGSKINEVAWWESPARGPAAAALGRWSKHSLPSPRLAEGKH